MTTSIARHPSGLPVGGQFASTSHSEPGITLDATPPAPAHTIDIIRQLELEHQRADHLPTWPADLPTPEVDFGFDTGALTRVTVDGETVTFWNTDDYGPMSSLTYLGSNTESGGQWSNFSAENRKAAMEWGEAVHNRVDDATTKAKEDIFSEPVAKAAVLSQAIGMPPATAPDLGDSSVRDDYQTLLEREVHQLQQKLQRSYLIEPAEELKAKHPKIESFTISGTSEQPVIDSAWDEDGTPLDHSVCLAASEVFDDYDSSAFDTLFNDEEIYVDEAIAWRP